ncbi:MAG: hypothetical protein V1716_02795 [Candidatus Uhrbacteria bacterium]
MEKIQIPDQTPRTKQLLNTIPYKKGWEIKISKFLLIFFLIGGLLGLFLLSTNKNIPAGIPIFALFFCSSFGYLITLRERRKIKKRKLAIINGKYYQGTITEHGQDFLAWSKRWKPVYTATVKFTTDDRKEFTEKVTKYFYPNLHKELTVGTKIDLLFDQEHQAVFFPYEIGVELEISR